MPGCQGEEHLPGSCLLLVASASISSSLACSAASACPSSAVSPLNIADDPCGRHNRRLCSRERGGRHAEACRWHHGAHTPGSHGTDLGRQVRRIIPWPRVLVFPLVSSGALAAHSVTFLILGIFSGLYCRYWGAAYVDGETVRHKGVCLWSWWAPQTRHLWRPQGCRDPASAHYGVSRLYPCIPRSSVLNLIPQNTLSSNEAPIADKPQRP